MAPDTPKTTFCNVPSSGLFQASRLLSHRVRSRPVSPSHETYFHKIFLNVILPTLLRLSSETFSTNFLRQNSVRTFCILNRSYVSFISTHLKCCVNCMDHYVIVCCNLFNIEFLTLEIWAPSQFRSGWTTPCGLTVISLYFQYFRCYPSHCHDGRVIWTGTEAIGLK